jgi:hypothetical protein
MRHAVAGRPSVTACEEGRVSRWDTGRGCRYFPVPTQGISETRRPWDTGVCAGQRPVASGSSPPRTRGTSRSGAGAPCRLVRCLPAPPVAGRPGAAVTGETGSRLRAALGLCCSRAACHSQSRASSSRSASSACGNPGTEVPAAGGRGTEHVTASPAAIAAARSFSGERGGRDDERHDGADQDDLSLRDDLHRRHSGIVVRRPHRNPGYGSSSTRSAASRFGRQRRTRRRCERSD